MGTEYYLYNHKNATVFDLGKGPWYLIEDMSILHTASHFVTWLKENWGYSDTSVEYHKILAKAVKEFTEDTPDEYLKIWGDCCEKSGWGGSLGYICMGSRYELGDPIKNKENIDTANELMIKFKNEYYPLTNQEIEKLKAEGWNFKNYEQKTS